MFARGLPAGRRYGVVADTERLVHALERSILNHDCAIAAVASRMTAVAEDRQCVEMGSRRTHEEAAIAAARSLPKYKNHKEHEQ